MKAELQETAEEEKAQEFENPFQSAQKHPRAEIQPDLPLRPSEGQDLNKSAALEAEAPVQ